MYFYFPSRYAWQVHKVWNSTWFDFCGYGSKTYAYKFHDLLCYSLRSQVNSHSACVSHMCLYIIFWLICWEPIIFILQVHTFLSITISIWEAWNLCVMNLNFFYWYIVWSESFYLVYFFWCLVSLKLCFLVFLFIFLFLLFCCCL